jgi:hypothetical protein
MSERTGIVGLQEDLAAEREVVRTRCPPYARALELLGPLLVHDGTLGRALQAAWEQRRFHAFYDRPLLLLAALRADARADPAHPLFEAFALREPRAEAVTTQALAEALDPAREGLYDSLIRRSVQTNETSRAVAWLWPAALLGASGGRRALALADVGASAGLNLVGDTLAAPWRFPDGTPVEVARDVHAVARLGLDQSPLDASRPEDADWLRACIWPGETVREERLEEALRAFAAARPRADAPVLVPILARNVPARLDLLSSTEREAVVLAYQTLLRDYLPPGDRAEYVAGMEEWLATHPPGRALWVELEPSGEGFAEPDRGCALTAHVRATDGTVRHLPLARCGPHPAVLHPDPSAVAELRERVRTLEPPPAPAAVTGPLAG